MLDDPKHIHGFTPLFYFFSTWSMMGALLALVCSLGLLFPTLFAKSSASKAELYARLCIGLFGPCLVWGWFQIDPCGIIEWYFD